MSLSCFDSRRVFFPLILALLVVAAAVPAHSQKASLSNNSLSFGSVVVGAKSAVKTVTLSNSSSTALRIASVVSSGDYSQTNTCGISVAARGSCVISVTFGPTAAGLRSGTVKITDNASSGSQTISLSGTGTAVASLSPASASFGSVKAGSTSSAKSFTLSNNQKTALAVSSIAANGDFLQTNNCSTSVKASGSCAINVTFKPTASGARTGTLTVVAGSGTTLSASLSGTGTGTFGAPPTVSPASLSFAAQNVNTTSAAQSVSLHNSLTTSLTISGITLSGDFVQTSSTCNSTLAANGTCAIGVSFKPTAAGTRTGVLSIADNASNSPQKVTVTGQGTAVTATLTSITLSSNASYDTLNPPPRQQAVPMGYTVQYAATGNYSDGTTKNITSSVTWSSSNPAVVAISPAGVAIPASQGAVNIIASQGGMQSSIILEVFPATATSATVTPASSSMASGTSQQFHLMATYSDGTTKDVSSSAMWLSAGNIAFVYGFGGGGFGIASVAGSGTVTAGFQNCAPWGCGMIGGDAKVTVTGNSLPKTLFIFPNAAAIKVADNLQLQGLVVDGTTVTDVTRTAQWTSNNSAVTVTTSGLATGVSGGTATVSATSAGLSSSASSNDAVLTVQGTGACTNSVDMKLLVVNNAANGYLAFPAVKQILDYLGTPYDVVDVSNGVTASMLSDGACHAYYQGVIFVVGDDFNRLPGVTDLTAYEQKFQIRQVNWYTFPDTEWGLNALDSVSSSDFGYNASFTPAGASVFSYANTANPLTFTRAYIYLATPATPSTGTVTPLLLDSTGHALSLIYDMGDGRQYLTQTFDSNNTVTHNLVLAYGLINWVTKGIFLGEYHVYAVPQVDDIFMQNDEFQSNTPCGNSAPLPQFRLSGSDFDQFAAWQTTTQQNTAFSNFVVQVAFVGSGATGNPSSGGFNPDTLTPEVLANKSSFNWISHTWDHQLLDNATAALTDSELLQNNAEAITLGLPGYSPANLVTPAITGLNNATFINEAVKDGLKYLVSDTSVLGVANNGPNPTPNVGIVNSFNSGLYEVPRHATNLFYNVSTPDDWAAEYHCIFAGQSPYDTFTYQQMLDSISQTLLVDMLIGDMDPQMYHMSNLRAYDGSHSLFGDLYDETFNTYSSLMKLPVLSPTLDQIGQKMQSRDAYNRSQVKASLTSTTITLTIPPASPVTSATIPVSGLNSNGAENYGSKSISHVVVNANQTVTLPLQ